MSCASGSLTCAIARQSMAQSQQNVQMAAAVSMQKQAMDISKMGISLIQQTLVNLSQSGGVDVLA